MTFINSIKPLKHTILLVQRDANAGIIDCQHCAVIEVVDIYFNAATRIVVFNTVLSEVVNYKAEELRITVDYAAFTGQFQ